MGCAYIFIPGNFHPLAICERPLTLKMWQNSCQDRRGFADDLVHADAWQPFDQSATPA